MNLLARTALSNVKEEAQDDQTTNPYTSSKMLSYDKGWKADAQ